MLITPVLFLLATAWFLYNQILSYQHAQASVKWPSTKGVVTHAHRQLVSIDDYANLTGVKVVYEYRVQKSLYTARTIAFSPKFMKPRRLILQYQAGKKVKIHHHPVNPEIATLEIGVTTANYVMLLTGGVLFLLATLNLLVQFI